MMTRIFYFLLVAELLSTEVYAGCDLTTFDKTPPAAISSDVDTGNFSFVWASDLDRDGSINWISNYIQNRHEHRSLAATWKKANIHFPYVRPLPPKEAYCNRYPVISIEDNDIDDDAPIVYGASNTVQRAAIYSKTNEESEKEASYISEITTSFVDADGKNRDVYAYYFYSVSAGLLTDMGMSIPDDMFMSIADISNIWSIETLKSFSNAANQQKANFYVTSELAFSNNEPTAKEFYASIDYPSGESLISKGTIKGFGAGMPVVSTIHSQVILYDSSRRPIVSGFMTMPVTKK